MEKADTFYYVALLQTLKTILSNEGMLPELLESRSTTTNLQDFCDGNIYKSHPLFSTNNQALQIIAYFDKMEIANPLGSYVAKHKLGCIFFMLCNINPRYRSTH